ncbi:hypothetical protein DS909_02160 [Phaeobacter gallaeciensis]|uniref:Uncharacterized protein n=2 Tax=Roseobacteraceae TaxID=2854170 RepID=A0A366XDC7_9RHOB|nr:hypothetical protein [Falsiruegeria litorea]MBT8168232.1 hypothetical protein [Falsiruegeria litorea]RBW61539.1 hypothetical protein DS909_02160 [Phaeobacter gallaeciensis]
MGCTDRSRCCSGWRCIPRHLGWCIRPGHKRRHCNVRHHSYTG